MAFVSTVFFISWCMQDKISGKRKRVSIPFKIPGVPGGSATFTVGTGLSTVVNEFCKENLQTHRKMPPWSCSNICCCFHIVIKSLYFTVSRQKKTAKSNTTHKKENDETIENLNYILTLLSMNIYVYTHTERTHLVRQMYSWHVVGKGQKKKGREGKRTEVKG